jgi:hypothetical protein
MHFEERLPWNESRPEAKDAASIIHQALPAAVSKNLLKTGFVSGGFLQYATQGRFTAAIQDLLAAIFLEDIKKKRRLLLELQNTGASSGIDVMAGILLTFSVAGLLPPFTHNC